MNIGSKCFIIEKQSYTFSEIERGLFGTPNSSNNMTLFVSITAVLFVVFLICSYKFKLYNKLYNPKNLSHNICIALTAGFCAVISFVIYHFLATGSFNYPYEYPLSNMNAYEQMFDALMKHQLNIDITPDPMLEKLNNPYDWDERSLYSFFYLWDRAYFGGKYYSYFGIAPILLIYFPFYFLSGKVPSAQTVCLIFALISVFAIALLVVKTHKVFLKKVNLSLLILSILATETGSLIFMTQASADFYYIAVASGITFLALFLLFSLCAYDAKKISEKCLYFSLSGLSLVFLVMSRPNLALYFIIAIPIYLSVIFSKKYKASDKFKQVLSFAIPTAIGAAFVMWYNYARFGSIFEFGAKYQLTVYDVSKYTFNTALILPGLYYYFFQYPKFISEFPYLDIPFYKFPTLNTYVYLTSTIGILSFPSVWGIACLPVSITSKNTDKTKKSILLLSVLSVFVMAIFDMCFAGVNIRYLADIALVAVLFTSVMLCDFFALFKTSSDTSKFVAHSVISILLVLSFLLGAYLIICNERNYLLNLL